MSTPVTIPAHIEHIPFESIPRLSKPIFCSEKLHGVNVGFHIDPETDQVVAQSRKQLITLANDVNGFARWVHENADALREQLGYGLHFGEWFGPGVQKKHFTNMTEKRFSLFNTGRWTSEFNEAVLAGADPDDVDQLSTVCTKSPLCHVVPLLAVASTPFDPKIMGLIEKLKAHGSYAAPGWMRPEGVVLYFTAADQYFKWFCENDHVPKSLVAEH